MAAGPHPAPKPGEHHGAWPRGQVAIRVLYSSVCAWEMHMHVPPRWTCGWLGEHSPLVPLRAPRHPRASQALGGRWRNQLAPSQRSVAWGAVPPEGGWGHRAHEPHLSHRTVRHRRAARSPRCFRQVDRGRPPPALDWPERSGAEVPGLRVGFPARAARGVPTVQEVAHRTRACIGFRCCAPSGERAAPAQQRSRA